MSSFELFLPHAMSQNSIFGNWVWVVKVIAMGVIQDNVTLCLGPGSAYFFEQIPNS
jgi:hypothetical protein